MEKMKNALVLHLAEMPVAAIYALADKAHLFNGFELCRRQPVTRVCWSDDGTILRLKLQDRDSVEVSLTLERGELSSSCDCGRWSPSGRCPHLVASLVTLKKAISSSSLPMLQLPQEYLEFIRVHLPEVSEAPRPILSDEGFRLVVERREDEVRLVVKRNDLPVSALDPTVPSALRDFLRLPVPPSGEGRLLEEFHSRFQGRYPVVYASPDGDIPLTLDLGPPRTMALRLDHRAGKVSVCAAMEDGTPLGTSSFATDSHFFDIPRRRVQRVSDSGGLRYFRRFLSLMEQTPDLSVQRTGEGISLKEVDFNRIQFAIDPGELSHFLSCATLRVAGTAVRPRQVEPAYRLNISATGGTAILLAEGIAASTEIPLSREAFSFFPTAARLRLPQPLRARKRMTVIWDACFDTLSWSDPGERERAVREALSGPDFGKRGIRSEARRLIASFVGATAQPKTLLQISELGWLAVGIDAALQARLLEIPYRMFGPDLFSESSQPGEMTLDRDLLFKNLPRLRRELAGAGFSLAIEGDQLEEVAWSFTLDATRSSIDWFELRPEIRWEGELVDEKELRDAVLGGGLFRRKGTIFVLDEESSRALSLLAAGGKREVVRVPRLQILDWIALRRKGIRVLLSPEDERIIENLTNFQRIEQLPVPSGLQATLRSYQKEGYSWLAFLYEHRFGACLADDMGLGKTIQALALLAGLREGFISSRGKGAPHLVVVPPSLIFNWESEISRFYPHLKVAVYRGQGRRARFQGYDVVLTSYGVIQRDIDELSQMEFDVIVFDEAQSIKNIHAETTGAVRRLRASFKLALTGTPVENHLGEYYSVMDLTLPGLLGPYREFRRKMAGESSDFLEMLITRTRPFVLRRTKDMIAAELPPKVETDIYLEMSARQKALYVRTVAQVKATVAEAYRTNSPGQARIIALTAILKLRQICLSTRLLLRDGREGSPKIEFLLEQLQELFDEGHSVLVFSQFTSFLDVVQEELGRHDIAFSRLDGSTPVGRRKELVQKFQGSAAPSVFLLSLKAGGRGLNLTRASYVFHLDPWWNPAVENQASDRAHRIGQQNQVTITRLLMRHTIEEKMMELKKRKLKLYRALLEESEVEGGFAIGREDFDFLLG